MPTPSSAARMRAINSMLKGRDHYRKTKLRKPKRKMIKVRGYRKRFVKVRRIQGKAGLLTQSKLALKHRVSPQVRTLKHDGSSNIYICNNSDLISSTTTGAQALWNYSLLNKVDIQTIGNRLPQNNNGPRRYILESVLSEMTYTNQTTASVEFEIIDFAQKRDLNANNAFAANGTTYNYGFDPLSVWQADSYACEGAGAGATNPATFLGARPFDGQLFGDLFKVLKRTIVMLPQGGSHRHVVNLQPNRLIDEGLWNNVATATTSALYSYAGLTVHTLIIAKGYPVHTTVTTENSVSTAIVNLACMRQLRYKFSYVVDNTKSITYNNTVYADATAVPNIVNVGSGQPEAERIA